MTYRTVPLPAISFTVRRYCDPVPSQDTNIPRPRIRQASNSGSAWDARIYGKHGRYTRSFSAVVLPLRIHLLGVPGPEIGRVELIRDFTLPPADEAFVRQFRGRTNMLGAAGVTEQTIICRPSRGRSGSRSEEPV